ncbi:thioredoxin family protein [Dyadobacter fanqingshengii]|uniref:Thioredoxin family protein n=1 Tax=Dyadobacter fanqingshengii TaxID=2906443 RepID=A0A9X1PFP9_9BACT|nr:thioredoxin fold domain-containing protein [Dyadobacter fanqingshengii]MCF0043615.1 thioredoxin family protein [Dyadobacter fanqingshengii]USJ34769.1 thioredoxin family protein [Dyadobacter fanqingshengii]
MKGLKKLSFLIAILTLTFATTIAATKADGDKKEIKAEEKGIQFTEAKWAEILKKAKAENKIIFFDAYTTWCGPCKMMQKNVFTRDDVAAVFNKDFINVKYDMESGEGLKLAGKYPLEAYPTLFFIDAKGKVVKQVIGYQTPEKLIDLAKSVQKKSPKAI